MGVYYYFRNMTTGEGNKKPLFEGSTITWIAKFNGDRREFEFVMKLNGWKETDEIRASSDDYSGHYYVYRNGRVFSGHMDLLDDDEGNNEDKGDNVALDRDEVLQEEEEVLQEESQEETREEETKE